MMVFPPQGATAHGGSIVLQWVSVGELQADEYYLVEVQDTTGNKSFFNVTRETSMRVSGDIVPLDGQVHAMQWRVRVGKPTANGAYGAIGADTNWRTFQWQNG